MLKRLTGAIVFLGLMAGHAYGATLSGDVVSVNLTTLLSGGALANDSGTLSPVVGLGEDASFLGSQFINFDAGGEGNEFTVRSTSSFSSINGAESVQWTLSDLDFVDGSTLVDFVILDSIAPTSISVTSNSAVITYADVAIPADVYLRGRFVTTSDVSAVPLPAALPLFAAALAGVGLISWRRGRSLG